ncbi:MAG: ABC transporter substrate-binding protein [Candidatus Bathyarchaeota archaeon]|nr:ABC transporter substrate-binding protein [Candidatus Bathyarchaeota archaeon]
MSRVSSGIWIKIIAGIIVGLLVGAVATYFLYDYIRPQPSPEIEHIKIGVSYPLSGVVAYEGRHCLDGTLLAVKEINEAGGIGGRYMIELVVEDDKCDPTEGATIAEKFITKDRVDIIVASFCSAVTLAMAPVAEENDVLFVNANSIADSITEQGWEWVFRVCDNSVKMSEALIAALVNDVGWKEMAIITSDDAMGIGSATAAKAEIEKYSGASVVAEYYIPRGTKDYYPYLTALKDMKPDGLILPMDAMDGAALINQYAELGLRDVGIGISGFGGFEGSEDFLELTGNNAEGLIDSTMYSPFIEPLNPRYEKVTNDFRSLYGYSPNKYAIRAYDSIKIIADAIERANSIEPADVREALLETSYTGPIGENLTFDDKHQLHRIILIIEIVDGEHIVKFQKLV